MSTFNYVINEFEQFNISDLIDLSWVAGFVDGEGWIGIARQKRKGSDVICHRLKFSIVQNNLEVLEQIKNILDESSFISKLQRTESMNRQAYQLVYDSSHALRAIQKIKPFLRKKQYEADAVEKMWEEGQMGKRPGSKGWPPEVYAKREKWSQKLSRLK